MASIFCERKRRHQRKQPIKTKTNKIQCSFAFQVRDSGNLLTLHTQESSQTDQHGHPARLTHMDRWQ